MSHPRYIVVCFQHKTMLNIAQTQPSREAENDFLHFSYPKPAKKASVSQDDGSYKQSYPMTAHPTAWDADCFIGLVHRTLLRLRTTRKNILAN